MAPPRPPRSADHHVDQLLEAPRAAPGPSPLHPSPFVLAQNHTRRGDSSSIKPDSLFDVPAPLAAFYAKLGTEGSLTCDGGGGVGVDKRKGGYKTNGSGKDGTRYCADKEESPSYVWWMSNMDIDCDGSDGTTDVCQGDGSFQSDTAFQDDAGKNIDAQAVQYVVIDQDGDFDPTKLGIQPLSVVAVLCGGRLTYGVWADTNALGSMGEASVYLGRVCYGSTINGNNGHGEPDVLYVAFPGSQAETVPSGYGSDEGAMFDLGKGVVEKAFGGDGGGNASASSSGTGGATASSSPAGGTAGLSTSPAATASTSAKTSPATSSHTASSSPSPTSAPTTSTPSAGLFDSLTSGSRTAPLLLLLTGIALLLAAGIAAWCVHRKAQRPPYAAAPRRRAPTRRRSTSSEDSGSSTEAGSESGSSRSEPESGSDSESEDEKKGEGKRLYREVGRRRSSRR